MSKPLVRVRVFGDFSKRGEITSKYPLRAPLTDKGSFEVYRLSP
jgi:hypothetical protein